MEAFLPLSNLYIVPLTTRTFRLKSTRIQKPVSPFAVVFFGVFIANLLSSTCDGDEKQRFVLCQCPASFNHTPILLLGSTHATTRTVPMVTISLCDRPYFPLRGICKIWGVIGAWRVKGTALLKGSCRTCAK